MSRNEKFVGTGVAMVTPFKNDGAIDFAVLERHTDELIKNGIDYLVVLGTTAETPTLSKQEKLEIIDVVKRSASGRVPIMIGAGGSNTAEVIEWIGEIGTTGIDAYLSVAPYYSKPSQTGMIQHFSAIATVSELPIMLYNVPGRTGSNIEAATTLQLAHDLGDKVVAIKEASGDFQQIMEIQKDKPEDFLVVSGDDATALISNGVICVAEGANMPSTPEAIEKFKAGHILFAPGKASNAGGVATSGLEMSQNSLRYQWTSEEVDTRLHNIMIDIHNACRQYGTDSNDFTDYVKGANLAGFVKVADAMIDQGLV